MGAEFCSNSRIIPWSSVFSGQKIDTDGAINVIKLLCHQKKQINHQIIQEQNSDPKAAESNYDGLAAKSNNMYKKP